jgi:hypothetical protein
MNKLLISLMLGALSLAATAQTTPGGVPSVTVPGYERIELPRQVHHMFLGDFDRFKGAYSLSNGQTLIMKGWGRSMYAQVGDGPLKKIVAAAPNVFVSLDEKLKITLNETDDGDMRGVLLMVVPRQGLS